MVVKLEHKHDEREMRVIHDETQKRWDVVKDTFTVELESIKKGLDELREELKQFSGRIDHGWEEYDKRLEEHSQRISNLSARLDKKKELDNLRDDKIKTIREDYNQSIKELHEELKLLKRIANR